MHLTEIAADVLLRNGTTVRLDSVVLLGVAWLVAEAASHLNPGVQLVDLTGLLQEGTGH